MYFLLTFVFPLLNLVTVITCSCANEDNCNLEPVGCYGDNSKRAMPEQILNERDRSSNVFSGHIIDWNNYEKYIKAFACRCAKVAREKGYSVFGLQFYGECWSGPIAHKTYSQYGKSTACVDGKFRAYTQQKDCTQYVGKQFINHVYRVKESASYTPHHVTKCTHTADVGFILDSSNSVKKDYQTEKDFLKDITAAFDISKEGSRASVITFSNIAKLSIRFKDFFDEKTFNKAVDLIPLMSSITRIDRALRLAQRNMFSEINGARSNVPKVLIVITDGSQTRAPGAEDPSSVADILRRNGINIIVVGIGIHVKKAELRRISGTEDKTFNARSFKELIDIKFINTLRKKSCKVASYSVPVVHVPTTKCTRVSDVGFLLDSSASIKKDYQTEKRFVKAIAAAFDISKEGSRGSVITFSNLANLSIMFDDFFDENEFNKAVDAIPLMASITRIDRALRLAGTTMFTEHNGARKNVPKVLILLTDGSQTRAPGAEHPAFVASELRQKGINVLVVGMGIHTNQVELKRIAGGSDKAFSVKSFKELVSEEFIKTLTLKSCKAV